MALYGEFDFDEFASEQGILFYSVQIKTSVLEQDKYISKGRQISFVNLLPISSIV